MGEGAGGIYNRLIPAATHCELNYLTSGAPPGGQINFESGGNVVTTSFAKVATHQNN